MNSRDRQFWTEFLLLYRSLPAVWKVKSSEYSSRALKSAGYDQLVHKLREVEPHADRALVVKKINSFRTNFRRDLRKREQSTEGGGEPFESTLWYFDLLGFLEGQEETLQKASRPDQEAFSEALRSKKRRLAVVDELAASVAARSTSPHACPGLCRRQQRRLSPPTESQALAHTWRSQYDELSPRQKLVARKLISDVLYYGCMDQLEPLHVAQLQQLMLSHSLSPQIEDVSASSRATTVKNYDESDSVDADG